MPTRTPTLRPVLQAGFTLIELIVVIVIIGILAAVAIPKFQELTTAAQQSATKAVASELGAAANIAFAKSKVDGTTVTLACTDASLKGYLQGGVMPAGYTVSGDSPSCTVTHTSGTTATFTLPQ